jgi:Uma2 family endonuclease
MGVLKEDINYTYDDYKTWEGKWELIDGKAYNMSLSPRLRHQETSWNITAEFKQKLKECNLCGAYMEVDYKISQNTIISPDVLISCETSLDAINVTITPQLVCEVASPSTKNRDRTIKFELYEKNKIKYYMMVDAQFKGVEIWKLDKENRYQLDFESQDGNYSLDIKDCKINIDVKKFWEYQ